MTTFSYQAINAQGIELKGELHAPDLEAARDLLRQRGLLPKKLASTRSKTGTRQGVFNKVDAKSLQIFSRQFATLIEAGVSVVSSLTILQEQTVNKNLVEGDRRGARRRRVRNDPLARPRRAPEHLRPPLRRDDRGRRGVGNARPCARPAGRADREGDADQAPREGRDDLPDRRPHLRVPRAHRDAALPRPGVQQDLRAAQRSAPDADADRRRPLEHAPDVLVHHLPGDRRASSSASAAGSAPSRAAAPGTA